MRDVKGRNKNAQACSLPVQHFLRQQGCKGARSGYYAPVAHLKERFALFLHLKCQEKEKGQSGQRSDLLFLGSSDRIRTGDLRLERAIRGGTACYDSSISPGRTLQCLYALSSIQHFERPYSSMDSSMDFSPTPLAC